MVLRDIFDNSGNITRVMLVPRKAGAQATNALPEQRRPVSRLSANDLVLSATHQRDIDPSGTGETEAQTKRPKYCPSLQGAIATMTARDPPCSGADNCNPGDRVGFALSFWKLTWSHNSQRYNRSPVQRCERRGPRFRSCR